MVAACHNAEDTVTISGDEEAVDGFVAEMEREGVFARKVDSSGVAFHSHHMASIAPQLQSVLEKVGQSMHVYEFLDISSSRATTPHRRQSGTQYHVNPQVNKEKNNTKLKENSPATKSRKTTFIVFFRLISLMCIRS